METVSFIMWLVSILILLATTGVNLFLTVDGITTDDPHKRYLCRSLIVSWNLRTLPFVIVAGIVAFVLQ